MESDALRREFLRFVARERGLEWAAGEESFAAAREARLTPVLGTRDAISAWAAGGGAWHLGVDTGMARAGARWDRVGALRDLLAHAPPEGVCTHFHSAERNDASRQAQVARFEAAAAELPPPAPGSRYLFHAENSAAIARSAPSRWSLVRPGIFLYGVGSGPGAQIAPTPVVHLRARIVEMRDVPDGDTVSYGATYRAVGARRIATVPVGYADGYRRALSNRGTALVRGRRVPVVGLVTMDMTMLDVTDAPCELGDVATLIGRDGEELLEVEAVACAGDLSPYELLTGLHSRLERVFVGDVP
jgi:alanine racemase